MGWSFYSEPGGPRARDHAAIKREIARLCTWENERGTGEPLQISRSGNVWFAAVECRPSDPNERESYYTCDDDGAYRFCAVFLTRYDRGWGYKDLTEAMGIGDARAPLSLISKLSPPNPDDPEHFARITEWRQACAEHAARRRKTYKPRDGDTVRLSEPLEFGDGIQRQRFTVRKLYKIGRRTKWGYICADTGAVCSLRGWMDKLERVEC